MDELDDIEVGDSSVLDDLRATHQKPHEKTILDWIERAGLEDVVFYPQGNSSILITWATPDSEDRYLLREIDIIIESDDRFRLSGGAMYHAPSYHIGWLSHRVVSTTGLEATLDDLKANVDGMSFDDLTEMEAYLATFMKDVLAA